MTSPIDDGGSPGPAGGGSGRSGAGEARPGGRRERHAVLLRLDPAVHEALTRWAQDEFRSVNAQVELVLRNALRAAGREPRGAGPLPRRGRPPSPSPPSSAEE